MNKLIKTAANMQYYICNELCKGKDNIKMCCHCKIAEYAKELTMAAEGEESKMQKKRFAVAWDNTREELKRLTHAKNKTAACAKNTLCGRNVCCFECFRRNKCLEFKGVCGIYDKDTYKECIERQG